MDKHGSGPKRLLLCYYVVLSLLLSTVSVWHRSFNPWYWCHYQDFLFSQSLSHVFDVYNLLFILKLVFSQKTNFPIFFHFLQYSLGTLMGTLLIGWNDILSVSGQSNQLLGFSAGRQLSPTELLAHSSLSKLGERIERVKVRKFMG